MESSKTPKMTPKVATIGSSSVWFHTKAEAIEYIDGNKDAVLIARDLDEGAKKEFGVIAKNVLFSICNEGDCPDEHLYCCNDVPNGMHKFIIDIDISKKDVGNDSAWYALHAHSAELPALIHSWISKKLATIWPDVELPTPYVYQSVSRTSWTFDSKLSFHLIYNVRFDAFLMIRPKMQVWAREEWFERPYWWPFNGFTFINNENKIKYIVDPAVYGRNLFRLPYQSKQGKDTILINRTNGCWFTPAGHALRAWSHWLIMNDTFHSAPIFPVDDSIIEALKVEEELTRTVEWLPPPVEDVTPNTDESDPFLYYLSVFPHDTIRDVQIRTFNAAKNYCKDVSASTADHIRESVINWFITPQHITKHGLDACREYMRQQYEQREGVATMAFMKSVALHYCPRIEELRFSNTASIELSKIYDCSDYNPTISESLYVEPIGTYLDNGDIVLHAAMGSGKTTRVREYVATHPDKSVLILTNRRVLSKSLFSDYKSLGFTHYDSLKVTGNICLSFDVNRFVVQLESIHLIQNYERFDLLILDECESIVPQLYSHNTHRDIMRSNTIFYDVLQSARRVVCMDAFISRRSFDLLNSFRMNVPRSFLKHTNNPRPRQCLIYETHQNSPNPTIIERINEDIIAGRRLYIFSSSLRLLKRISFMISQAGIDKSRILEITSELSNAERERVFSDVDAAFSSVDYLLASPSMTVGVNFNQDWFHSAYIFISSSSCCVRDCIQSSMRCRTLTSNTIHFQIEVDNKSDSCEIRDSNADAFQSGYINDYHRKAQHSVELESTLSRRYPRIVLETLLNETGFTYSIASSIEQVRAASQQKKELLMQERNRRINERAAARAATAAEREQSKKDNETLKSIINERNELIETVRNDRRTRKTDGMMMKWIRENRGERPKYVRKTAEERAAAAATRAERKQQRIEAKTAVAALRAELKQKKLQTAAEAAAIRAERKQRKAALREQKNEVKTLNNVVVEQVEEAAGVIAAAYAAATSVDDKIRIARVARDFNRQHVAITSLLSNPLNIDRVLPAADSALDYVWMDPQFNYESNKIDFNMESLATAISNLESLQESKEEKELINRFYFQHFMRFTNIWTKSDDLNTYWSKWCINSAFRNNVMSRISFVGRTEQVEGALVCPYTAALIRRHILSLCVKDKIYNNHLDVDSKEFKELALYIRTTAARFGFKIKNCHVKGDTLSIVQVSHLLEDLDGHLGLGLHIESTKKQVREDGGARAWVYKHCLKNTSPLMTDCRLMASLDMNDYELNEMVQFKNYFNKTVLQQLPTSHIVRNFEINSNATYVWTALPFRVGEKMTTTLPMQITSNILDIEEESDEESERGVHTTPTHSQKHLMGNIGVKIDRSKKTRTIKHVPKLPVQRSSLRDFFSQVETESTGSEGLSEQSTSPDECSDDMVTSMDELPVWASSK